jgi:hypothetical protein
MAPRHLLSVLPFIGAALSLSVVRDRSECKAFPGTCSWPSSSAWDQLNNTVSGQLIKAVPPGGVCHEGQPNFDEAKCASVQESWLGAAFHINDPVSTLKDNWANFTCQPDPEAPCSGDAYPAYVIDAITADQVKAGIDFGMNNPHERG